MQEFAIKTGKNFARFVYVYQQSIARVWLCDYVVVCYLLSDVNMKEVVEPISC